MAMWRQRTLNSSSSGGPQPLGLSSLDPNASSSARHNHQSAAGGANLSKQSIDFDRSETTMMMSQHQLSGASASQVMFQHQLPSQQHMFVPAPGRHVEMPTANVSTAPPPVSNHRDRFQMYLERYAPNHPETTMRRAQLITNQTAMDHNNFDGFDNNNNNNNNVSQQQYSQPPTQQQLTNRVAQQQQQHFPSERQDHHNQQQQQQQQHQHNNGNDVEAQDAAQQLIQEQIENTNTIVDDIEAQAATVVDVRPERLRFELCASRSEADQLRKRIAALQNMNDHLREKLEQTLLSEREQAVRANSIESHDRSTADQLADAKAEIRELRRRLGESQTAHSQTETKLAQCRGRLAAFDHIASEPLGSSSSSSGGLANNRTSRHDSVTELVQTLSTSHYLLSVMSVLRFMFSNISGNTHHQQHVGIQVHIGGGVAPMQVSTMAQASEALQALVCGNRETENEMRTRVVGWTPDDMLREIRSVVMTSETMVVRLLTDGAVGTMLRTGTGIMMPSSSSSNNNNNSSVQTTKHRQPQAPSINNMDVIHSPPPNSSHAGAVGSSNNLINYVAASAVSKQKAPSRHPQHQHQHQHQQLMTNSARGGVDDEEEEWLEPRSALPVVQQSRAADNNINNNNNNNNNNSVHERAGPVQRTVLPRHQQPNRQTSSSSPAAAQSTMVMPMGVSSPAGTSSPSPSSAAAEARKKHTLYSPDAFSTKQQTRNIGVTYDAAGPLGNMSSQHHDQEEDGQTPQQQQEAADTSTASSGVGRLRSMAQHHAQEADNNGLAMPNINQEEDPCKVQ